MNRTLQLRSLLVLGASATALIAGTPALAQSGASAPSQTVGEIVVTAQRKSETLQNVPLAVSAFSPDALKVQRLDGGQNLELSIPNVNYSRSNFGGYNFQIRGIGTKVVSPTGDPGVSFNINSLAVAANHLGDTDFYDVERVEVLRGPQGTLYGRNATGGAVNVIYAKPSDIFSGALTGEYGNYDEKKLNGFINLPLGDAFALRLAGFYLDRGGFGTNQYNGDKIDDRHLGSGRATLRFHPTDKFTADLTFEHFAEDDNRNRVGKQLCHTDAGPTSLDGVGLSTAAQGMLSQGCSPGSLYSSSAYGAVNSQGTLSGVLGMLTGLTSGNQFANNGLQNSNLHDIDSSVDPKYKAEENLTMLNMAWEVSDHLTLSSITGFNHDVDSTVEDYNRLVPTTTFNVNPAPVNYFTAVAGIPYATYAALYHSLFPNGYVSDPQVGTSNKLRSYDYSADHSTELSEELRLASSFKGPLNYSVGVQYVNSELYNDYVVESNPLTAYAELTGLLIAPNNPPTYGSGYNFYDAHYHVKLQSSAAFGEVYYQIAHDLKLTVGARYTVDAKQNVYYPIELLTPPTGSLNTEKVTFKAPTGRVNLEWSPQLPFTNHTIIYGSYSRGYQGGGFNTPCANLNGCGYGATFAPVYVDAFEAGTKNTLANGSIMLNLTGFYYNEKGYQISQIVNKSSVNSNINASIYGVEFESLWSPVHDLTFNANVGYLHTQITSGVTTDQLNLTQGNPYLTVVKASDGSNCVVNTAYLAGVLSATPGYAQGLTLLGACSGGLAAYGVNSYSGIAGTDSPTQAQKPGDIAVTANGIGLGVNVDLKGKRLPNSPDFTTGLGAQYVWHLEGWKVTLRGDYYWQDASYARVFNTTSDYLKSWDMTNATLNFDRPDWGLSAQLYVKNVFNAQPLTDAYLTDASSGLFQNVFTLDPRTFGVSVTKKFD